MICTIFYLKLFFCITLIVVITVTYVLKRHIEQNEPKVAKNEKKINVFDNKFNNATKNFIRNSEKTIATQSLTRPWFFLNGNIYPEPAALPNSNHRSLGNKLFPEQEPQSDRIVNQLMYVPHNYEEIRKSGKLKTIFLFSGLEWWWTAKEGQKEFLQNSCPVNTCQLTDSDEHAATADMLLYNEHFAPSEAKQHSENSKQIKMIYLLESPVHWLHLGSKSNAFNWTATYRRDSDIVTPYGKWQYYDPKVTRIVQQRNYAANKTKKVAWVVSNCHTRNQRRDFALELRKYIDVDIYGECGEYECLRMTKQNCFESIERDYKFYLSFENSNCKDYITEKFFLNALQRNILPIVMGAPLRDYTASAPPHSFIHVDKFASPRKLAKYLHKLDKDDELYNSYFQWKGTGEFINTYFWCRVCALLHDEESLKEPRWYPNIDAWFFEASRCRNHSRHDLLKHGTLS